MLFFMKKFLKRLADNKNPKSLATDFRRKRFAPVLKKMEELHQSLNRPLKILDVGGTKRFWENMEATSLPHQITLLNIKDIPVKHPNFTSMVGSACKMDYFSNNEFDLVFSNSVIEHVGNFDEQMQMAGEVRRVSPFFFVQTPNYCFPIEPHFVFPIIHWLPRSTRIFIVEKLSLGWKQGKVTREAATENVDNIKLLKYSQVKKLFPDAQIKREKLFGLTKSFMAVKF